LDEISLVEGRLGKIAGLVNDRGYMERMLADREIAKRKRFADEVSEQDLGITDAKQMGRARSTWSKMVRHAQ
jgi:hypothetical protein